MPTITPAQAFLIGLIVSPSIFAASAYFTHANLRQIAGALVGALAYGAINFAWDRAAALAGWWQYPAYNLAGQLPLPIYAFSGLVYGGFGLIGWRITRRFGKKGLVIFLAAWSLWGFFHDVAGSYAFASSNLMVLGQGLAPLVADLLLYATCMACVLGSIRLISGPFSPT